MAWGHGPVGFELYEPAGRPDNEVQRERAVERSGALRATSDPVLRAIVSEARRVTGTAMAAVSIVYQDWQYLIATDGLPEGPYSRRTSFCGHAIMAEEPVFVVPDASADPRFADNPLVAKEGLLRFYAGARLVDEARLPLGSLCVLDPDARQPLRDDQARRLRELADRVMARIGTLRQGQAGAGA